MLFRKGKEIVELLECDSCKDDRPCSTEALLEGSSRVDRENLKITNVVWIRNKAIYMVKFDHTLKRLLSSVDEILDNQK